MSVEDKEKGVVIVEKEGERVRGSKRGGGEEK
jgi:hypothetical protein